MPAPPGTPSPFPRAVGACLIALLAALIPACAPGPARHGDEIVVGGRWFRVGSPVVLWSDPGGYNAYLTSRRFAPPDGRAPVPEPALRYGERRAAPGSALERRVLREGWSLDLLRDQVDQFVVHYDAAGTSRACFRILHDVRGLSVHFMIDVDGTIYQTLDVRERAWHATIANDRSVGVELANIGAFPANRTAPLERWYAGAGPDERLVFPPEVGGGGVRGPGPFRPARPGLIAGTIQGQGLVMHDYTAAQYAALSRLTGALAVALPGIALDCPRDAQGRPTTSTLPPERLAAYRGLLGHYHVQDNKVDPGPAFDWERVLAGARSSLGAPAP